jgi:hypothetical protein
VQRSQRALLRAHLIERVARLGGDRLPNADGDPDVSIRHLSKERHRR